jgi:hypothetical protein
MFNLTGICKNERLLKYKKIPRHLSNLLSLLFPVALSTTVDFNICGFARSIKYSHSSLLWHFKNNSSDPQFLPTHETKANAE